MASKPGTVAQVFWSTTLSKANEKNSVRFDVVGDGILRDYRIDLDRHPQWRGVVVSLRFDPVNQADTDFVIDFIRLVSGPLPSE